MAPDATASASAQQAMDGARDLGPTGIDAYSPAQIALRIEEAACGKARLRLVSLFTLAVLAGAFIAFGAALFTFTITGAEGSLGGGPIRFLGGLAFSLGLVLVIVGGGELFTGNALIVMAAAGGRIGWNAVMRNWAVSYAGNAVGAVGIAVLFWLAGLLEGPVAQTAIAISEAKMTLSLGEAFWRGVGCNVLVCLAVWLSLAARNVTGKVAVIVLPVTAFVAMGFEHSIANFYLVPQGWLAGGTAEPGAFAVRMVLVTLGNIVGGAGGVGLAYRLAYGGGFSSPRKEASLDPAQAERADTSDYRNVTPTSDEAFR